MPLTKTHAVRKDATASVVFIELFNRFETRIPHKFDTMSLMRFQFFHQFFVHRNQFFFCFRIEIQHQFIKLTDLFQFCVVHFIVLKIQNKTKQKMNILFIQSGLQINFVSIAHQFLSIFDTSLAFSFSFSSLFRFFFQIGASYHLPNVFAAMLFRCVPIIILVTAIRVLSDSFATSVFHTAP